MFITHNDNGGGNGEGNIYKTSNVIYLNTVPVDIQ